MCVRLFASVIATPALIVVLASFQAAAQDDPATQSESQATPQKPADEKAADPAENSDSGEKSADDEKEKKVDPPGLKRLAKDYDVWIDLERKLVVVDGKVCLRHGPLEMFACPRGTKEHEAIVSVNSPAQFVHAGLLAVGAKQGSPVTFRPEYRAASGTIIDVWVLWKDTEGMNRKVRAQEWIQNIKTEKAMQYDWVFAGSGFRTDEETGERIYFADGGDFICVSNFPTATLDLPVESSQANEELLFNAFTDRIPPMGTEVRLVLVPRIPRESKNSGDDSATPEKDAPPDAVPAPSPPIRSNRR